MLVPLADARARCGAKAAGLGRLLRAGFAVPDGFVIDDPGAHGWERALAPALRRLGGGPFAVRSSAPAEDGAEASFAGQWHTTLNAATPKEVAGAVRRTAASGDGEGIIAYAARAGVARSGGPVRVSVIVQSMVAPEVAGVMFTRHPVTGAGQVVIEAVEGPGDRLVVGAVTPERWMCDGEAAAVPYAAGVLTERQARHLAGLARRIEDLFGRPQDIEWAIAGGTAWVLQARPITTTPHATAPPIHGRAPAGPRAAAERSPVTAMSGGSPTAAGRALVTGTAAGPGTASGPVRVISGPDDFRRFRAGDVLVCRTTSPAWTPLLARAAAVITETGGILAHAAIVAREFGIPAVVAEDATAVLADGRPVVVDGTGGTVTAAGEETAR